MPIEESEWASISAMAQQIAQEVSGGRRDFFVTGKVIKRDENKNLVWLEEFGSQPIPLFTFDYQVKYYDESPRGIVGTGQVQRTYQKEAKTKVICPKVGETVLVARELGLRRLPRCLGVLRSRDFIIETEE